MIYHRQLRTSSSRRWRRERRWRRGGGRGRGGRGEIAYADGGDAWP